MTSAEALVKPQGQATSGLQAQPEPGNLDHHASHSTVTSSNALLLIETAPALPWRRSQAGQSCELTPVLEVTPAEQLAHQQPGAARADPPQLFQMAYQSHRRLGRALLLLAPLHFGSPLAPDALARAPDEPVTRAPARCHPTSAIEAIEIDFSDPNPDRGPGWPANSASDYSAGSDEPSAPPTRGVDGGRLPLRRSAREPRSTPASLPPQSGSEATEASAHPGHRSWLGELGDSTRCSRSPLPGFPLPARSDSGAARNRLARPRSN